MTTQVNHLESMVQTLEEIEAWHLYTQPAYRTIDHLYDHLVRKQKNLPFSTVPPDQVDRYKLINVATLAMCLHHKKLDFLLTRLLVDVLLRPARLDDLYEPSYQFFLDHYSEHPCLEKCIRQSISTYLRLRVAPVIPADGNLMAWLFDPSGRKMYQFSVNSADLMPEITVHDRGVVSIGTASVCKEYFGDQHPFSKLYLENVERCKLGLMPTIPQK